PIPLPHTHGGDGQQFASAGAVGADANGFDPPGFVPLESVAKIETIEGPNQISRENGKRRIVVQANVRDRDIASFVTEARERVVREVPLPPGVWLRWGGQYENLVNARSRLALVLPVCALVILLLL